MQSQSQNTQFSPEVQTTYYAILEKVEELYQKFIPAAIRLRRNINQQKQTGTVIISTIIWGMMMGFPSQADTYRAICALLYDSSNFPSRSRHSRICGNYNFWHTQIFTWSFFKLTSTTGKGFIKNFEIGKPLGSLSRRNVAINLIIQTI